MTHEEYRKAIDIVIYLAGCAVNGSVPDKKRIDGTDLEILYKAADSHLLTAVVAYSLKKAGITDHAFEQAKAKSIRKVTTMDTYKKMLFKRLDQENIWYMPLKGTIIKDLYPGIGIRQMADFDILFDRNHAERLRDIMLELGFTCEHFDQSNHDVYYRQPVTNFEMHRLLFDDISDMYDYYLDVKSRLIKDEGDNCGYHFSSSDLYIYLTAHEYKHYSVSGTGLRSVLDTYVIWQKLGDQFDQSYIRTECEKLGISEFEQKNKSLALHLFGDSRLTEDDKLMLEYIIDSGTYGTISNSLKANVGKFGTGRSAKMKFLFRKIFLPMRYVKMLHPTVYRHKILLPFLPAYRVIRAVTVKRKETAGKLKIIKRLD